MPGNNALLDLSIVSSINDIPRDEWQKLFKPEIIEGYDYQRTLEESGIKEFTFRYLIAKKNLSIVAIIPFFIMHFSFDNLISGRLHALARRLKNFLSMDVLFVGAPTQEELYFGLAQNEDLAYFFSEAIRKLRGYCKKNKIKGIAFNNISEKNMPLIRHLEKNSFFKMETLPTTAIGIKAESLDDFIQNLSKNTRKDLKRKLRRSQELAQLTTIVSGNIDGLLPDIYRLYLNNFTDADIHFETLTPDFFQNICKNMPEESKYFLTFDKDKLVAFNLCLMKNGHFIDKFIGFDLEVAHRYHLYFTTLMHNLEWCIKNGYKTYQPGISDYYPKLRMGAELIPLFIYAQAINPVFHAFLKLVSPFIQPKNLDSTLREIEAQKKKGSKRGRLLQ